MPEDFKDWAPRALAHAKHVIALIDKGEWTDGANLRAHYEAVVSDLEQKLGVTGGP